jgi:plastocyanin
MGRKPAPFQVDVKVDFGPAEKPAHAEKIYVEKGTTPKEAVSQVSQVFPVMSGKTCCSFREIMEIGGVRVDPAKNRWWTCKLNGSTKVSPAKTKLKKGNLVIGISKGYCQEIQGKISIEPPYPAVKMVKVKKKVQDKCADEQKSKALLVSPEGGVENAVVWLEGEYPPTAPAKQFVTLDQSRCNFEPHIVLIPPGGSLKILNSDPLAHDVRAFEKAMMLFRLDMDTRSKPEERSFEKPGIYTVRCGLHPWMHAFAVQAAHDFYAVTGTDGTFNLKNIPEGKHRLHIWHETLGETEIPLEVNQPVKDFSYTFKSKGV